LKTLQFLAEGTVEIVEIAKAKKIADLTNRIFEVTAIDNELLQTSFLTVYLILNKDFLKTARGA
jgi:hypothetical protein